MKLRRPVLVAVAVLLIAAVGFLTQTPWYGRLIMRLQGKRTLAQRLTQYGPAARERLVPELKRRGIDYPPGRIVLLALKDEREMQVYVGAENGKLRYFKTYPILGASGKLGPKLREGDMQVPEGIYRVVFLNPNSLYHLALRLNYPNEFDLQMAARDHRRELGGDIMIHGYKCSIGCLAMGNPASEDLFILAADLGIENIRVIIAPTDLRTHSASTSGLPKWTGRLYKDISAEMANLPMPNDARN